MVYGKLVPFVLDVQLRYKKRLLLAPTCLVWICDMSLCWDLVVTSFYDGHKVFIKHKWVVFRATFCTVFNIGQIVV